MSEVIWDAEELLRESADRHGIRFAELVAETGLWASPEVHRKLLEENGTGAWFPNMRRAREPHGEKRGQVVDGVKLDDNSAANVAIKKAIGVPRDRIVGFETCHIWPGTAYDPRYHTTIANLVLLPRAVAGLSDHDREIQAALQYRAFELYGWFPDTAERPTKPDRYPELWRNPELFTREILQSLHGRRSQGNGRRVVDLAATSASSPPQRQPQLSGRPLTSGAASLQSSVIERMSPEERDLLIRRIREWAGKPFHNHHRIVGIVARAADGIERNRLVQEVARVTGSRNPAGAVASMMTSRGNSYGRVFVDEDGIVRLHPDVAEEILRHRWS